MTSASVALARSTMGVKSIAKRPSELTNFQGAILFDVSKRNVTSSRLCPRPP